MPVSHTIALAKVKLSLLQATFQSADADLSARLSQEEWRNLFGCLGIDTASADLLYEAFGRNREFIQLDEFCHFFNFDLLTAGEALGLVKLIKVQRGLLLVGLQRMLSLLERQNGAPGGQTVDAGVGRASVLAATALKEKETPIPKDIWVGAFRMLSISEMNAEAALAWTREVTLSLFSGDETATEGKVSTLQLVHALAIDGSPAQDLRPLMRFKTVLLERMFYQFGGGEKVEGMERDMLHKAVCATFDEEHINPQDLNSTFEDVFKGEEYITCMQFCRVLASDQHTQNETSKETMRKLEPLVMATSFHRFCSEDKCDDHSWRTSGVISDVAFTEMLKNIGLSEQISVPLYVLLDVTHEMNVKLIDLEKMLCDCGLEELKEKIGRQAEEKSKQEVDTCLKAVGHGHGQKSAAPETLAKRIVEDWRNEATVGCLILFNAIMIGIETESQTKEWEKDWAGWPGFFKIMNGFFSFAFLIEFITKILAYGRTLFYSIPNSFDFLLVVMSVGDFVRDSMSMDESSDLPSFSVLRVFRLARLIRIFRFLSLIRELRLLAQGLWAGVRAFFFAFVILLVFLYVCAIFTCQIIGYHIDDEENLDFKLSPFDWDDPREFMRTFYGGIGESMFTMFQIMTLESWANGIVRPTNDHFPGMNIFFTSFICITLLALLNLVAGIFVEATVDAAKRDNSMQLEREREFKKIIIKELIDVFKESDIDKSGHITREEFEVMVIKPHVRKKFAELGFAEEDIDDLFVVLDSDHEGTLVLKEFVSGIVRLMDQIKPKDILVTQGIIKAFQRALTGEINSGLQKISRLLKAHVREVRTVIQPKRKATTGSEELLGEAAHSQEVETRLTRLEEGQKRLEVATKEVVDLIQNRLSPVAQPAGVIPARMTTAETLPGRQVGGCCSLNLFSQQADAKAKVTAMPLRP